MPIPIDLTTLANEPDEETFDDNFQTRDNGGPIAAQLEELAKLEEVEQPPVEAPPVEPPPAAPPAEEQAPEEPEVRDLGDGHSLKTERIKGVWNLTLYSGHGQPEVFKGATKGEAYERLAAGKAAGTALIAKQARELREHKRFADTPAQPTPPTRPAAQAAPLTAEQVLELRTLLNSNPDKALDRYFEARFGMSPAEAAERLQKADNTSALLEAEAVSKSFLSIATGFVPSQKNFKLLVKSLAKDFLRKRLTDLNQEEILRDLYASGHWTVDNLYAAYEDLESDGLFDISTPVVAPPEPAPPVVPETPVSQPQRSSRVIGETRRASAGFGVRPSATAVAPVDIPKAHSDEETSVEDLSLDQLRTRIESARDKHYGSQSRR